MKQKHQATPKVAFIIISWNNGDLLDECFQSIEAQTYKNHVTILVDNASADDSVELTRRDYPWVEVVETGSNLGFAAGNNVGVRHTLQQHPDVDYFVYLNSDARVEKNWLDTLIGFAAQKPKGALFQSITLDYYDHAIMDSSHIYVSREGSGTQSSWRKPFKGEKGPRKVFGVNAAAVLMSRRFHEAQPFNDVFDETMFMYLEDVDLSARATVMGWDNYLVPGTVAYHMGSASSGKRPGFSLYMTYRNNIAMLAKNIPLRLFVRLLPAMIRADRHTIRHLRRIGQDDAVPKLIKGRIVGLIRLPLFILGIIRMRKYRRNVSNEYLWQLMRRGW